MMIKQAHQIGANVEISVCYNTTELISCIREVLCYGTATVLEKADDNN